MKTEQPILITSITAAADLVKHRFVKYDGNYASLGQRALGVCIADTKHGEQAPVCTHGIVLVETSASFVAGDSAGIDENGKIKGYAGQGDLLYVLDASSGAGNLVRVKL